MTIKFDCDTCEFRGTIDMQRTLDSPMSEKVLEALEESELGVKEMRHQKDAGHLHHLRGSFVIPKELERTEEGMLTRRKYPI